MINPISTDNQQNTEIGKYLEINLYNNIALMTNLSANSFQTIARPSGVFVFSRVAFTDFPKVNIP
jgi:hypothetical protein